MLTQITIDNFREIKHLSIDNIKQVNIIIGKNNVGKTTLLEALFIAVGAVNIRFPLVCDFWRNGGIPSIKKSTITNLFHYDDTNIPISIEAIYDSLEECRSFISSSTPTDATHDHMILQQNISPSSEYIPTRNSFIQETNGLTSLKQKDSNILGIKMDYSETKNSDTRQYKAELQIQRDGIVQAIPKNYTEHRVGVLCPPMLRLDALKNNYVNVVKNNKKQDLISILKHFDNNITNIEYSEEGFFVEVKREKILPLSIMGDGIKKFLTIISSFYTPNITQIFIDEIENGLHYSSNKHLLKSLIRLSHELGVQIFITTHSLETLKFLSEIVEEESFSKHKENIQVINISKKDGKFFAFNHNMDGLNHFIKTETEVR